MLVVVDQRRLIGFWRATNNCLLGIRPARQMQNLRYKTLLLFSDMIEIIR